MRLHGKIKRNQQKSDEKENGNVNMGAYAVFICKSKHQTRLKKQMNRVYRKIGYPCLSIESNPKLIINHINELRYITLKRLPIFTLIRIETLGVYCVKSTII